MKKNQKSSTNIIKTIKNFKNKILNQKNKLMNLKDLFLKLKKKNKLQIKIYKNFKIINQLLKD